MYREGEGPPRIATLQGSVSGGLESILAIADPEAFELGMHDLVRSLKTSHTGFFHRSVRRVPGGLR